MPHPEQPVPVLSPAEYQAMTLHEVADELVVGAVAYSRSEWEPDPEDGVRHRTHTTPTTATAAATVAVTMPDPWDSSELPA
ncbi:hypothetical protein [Streptomyces lydicus]|uniref:hypothetical protein n=1 Tax=Streptomyces lydicus TaxID=47763 RepID=UPI0010119802|nr:hypothetical protein [Streptomyces lydicus]